MATQNRRCVFIFLTAISGLLYSHIAFTHEASETLADLTLAQLSEIEIISASKQVGSVLDSPASVYVISRENIRRSGANSIPEALRLAPGIEVARVGSHQWAISIRGFNNSIANKLLVLIDGRSVYSPLYAGVFWDVQDTLLEDVERIEVVSGPGGTLWGANAVNGVINIITRSATETQGGFAEIGGGNEERIYGGFRYGGHPAEDLAMRVYVKSFERDGTVTISGQDAGDDWRMAQGGFRLDWSPSSDDQLTLQGDIYSGREDDLFDSDFALGSLPGDSFRDETQVSGGNLIGRWGRQKNNGDQWRWQIYYDHTQREIPASISERRNTMDVEFQYNYAPFRDHNLIWGVGFRLTEDHIDNSLSTAFVPGSRSDQTLSAFFQDEVTLKDKELFLTVGSKFEDNEYSGFEIQPNLRLTWLIDDEQTAWAAVSRAVRIPSRFDTDLRLIRAVSAQGSESPVYASYLGNPNFQSEELVAHEAGYRIQARDNLSFDISFFYNDYDLLQTFEPGEPIIVSEPAPGYTIIPNVIGNEMEGESYGGVLVSKWQPLSNWRLEFHYAALKMQVHTKPGSGDVISEDLQDSSPNNQFSVHSYVDLPRDLALYSGLRHVGAISRQDIPAYTALDMTLQWRARENFTLSLVGRNLTDSAHIEFASSDLREVERSIHGRITWKF